ncbi:MAG: STAS domain-containing protein [Thermoanaerobaculia bacterium]
MILQRTRSQGCSILTVGGVVKLGESAQFFAQSLDQALAEDSGHLIIDFSQINYIDSTGIGELVGYLARFKERGRKLILVHPAERLQKLLAVAGLLELFPVYDTAEAAIAAES